MFKRARTIALIAIVAMALVSCAGMQAPEQELTPLQKAEKAATWMQETYSAQYDDYKAMVARPNLTEAQKRVLRTKYAVLTEAEPLIKTFRDAVRADTVPSSELETQIMDLLTRLQTMTTK